MNFIPGGDVSGGETLVVDLAALDISEMTDVVGGPVSAGADKKRLAAGRKGCAFGEDRVKRDVLSPIRLAPNPEMARKLVFKGIAGHLVRRDRQSNCGGSPGVGGPAEASSIALPR
jgi:hypothetical protein